MPDFATIPFLTILVVLVTVGACLGILGAVAIMRALDRPKVEPVKVRRKRRTKAQITAATIPSYQDVSGGPKTGAGKTATRVGQTTGSGSGANAPRGGPSSRDGFGGMVDAE